MSLLLCGYVTVVNYNIFCFFNTKASHPHMSEMCSQCVPVAQRIHAGLGPHHPGAGDLLS